MHAQKLSESLLCKFFILQIINYLIQNTLVLYSVILCLVYNKQYLLGFYLICLELLQFS